MRYAILAATLALTGCAGPTYFERSVSIERNAEGKILKKIETERILRQISGWEEWEKLDPTILGVKQKIKSDPDWDLNR